MDLELETVGEIITKMEPGSVTDGDIAKNWSWGFSQSRTIPGLLRQKAEAFAENTGFDI